MRHRQYFFKPGYGYKNHYRHIGNREKAGKIRHFRRGRKYSAPTFYSQTLTNFKIYAIIINYLVFLFFKKIRQKGEKLKGRREKMNQRNWVIGCSVALAILIVFWIIQPDVEVRRLNKSPISAGDNNWVLLPAEKAQRVYPWLVIIQSRFGRVENRLRWKDYLKDNPLDAITIGTGTTDGQYAARVYTFNPDRVKRYIEYLL